MLLKWSDWCYRDEISSVEPDEIVRQMRLRFLLVSLVAPIPILGPRLAIRIGGENMFSPEFVEQTEISMKDHLNRILSATPLVGSLLQLRKDRAKLAEGEDKLPFHGWLLAILILPVDACRKTIENRLFHFWEDELEDLGTHLNGLFLALGKVAVVGGVVGGVVVIPAVFLLLRHGAFERTETQGNYPAMGGVVDFERKQEEQRGSRWKLTKSELTLNPEELIAKYEELDGIESRTNLEKINNLSAKISVANKLFRRQQFKSTAWQHLLESSIDFALVCFDGSLEVPEEILANLQVTLEEGDGKIVELSKLLDFASLISRIANGDIRQWEDVENQFEELLSKHDFDTRRQHRQLAKLSRVAEHSTFFRQPNRFKEIAAMAYAKANAVSSR